MNKETMQNPVSFTSVTSVKAAVEIMSLETIRNNSITTSFKNLSNASQEETFVISLEEVEKFCLEIIEDILFYVTEEHGRDLVHLLPEMFQELEDVVEVPDVLETGVKETIEMLAEMLGCTQYETSFFEFWFLDVIADGLIKAQKQKMTQENQKILIRWFCFSIKQFEKNDNYETFTENLKKLFYLAFQYITEKNAMPTPEIIEKIFADSLLTEEEIAERELQEDIRKMNELNEAMQAVVEKPKKGKGKTLPPAIEVPKTKEINKKPIVKEAENKTNAGVLLQDSLSAIIQISAILQSVFTDEMIFKLVSSFFKKRPLCLDVYSPYDINIPKMMLFNKEETPAKGKDKKESAKPSKTDKSAKPAAEAVVEEELIKEKEIDVRDVICPLQMGVEASFFEELWPPGLEKTTKTDKGKKKK